MIETDKFILFWKDKLSNFSYSPFIDETGIKFFCVEQYFMYQKAITFNDQDIATKILRTTKPWEAKALGRQVSGYDDSVWSKVREDIMFKGNLMKYKQNKSYQDLLLKPEWRNKRFVEANPYDKIWAIGLSPEDPLAWDESNWRGLNLLGKVLDKVRAELLK